MGLHLKFEHGFGQRLIRFFSTSTELSEIANFIVHPHAMSSKRHGNNWPQARPISLFQAAARFLCFMIAMEGVH